ncbi:hypothetical protein GIB67_007815 [Kingdonia uniflora]|uniref:ABC1 atypical kinase-like domain-containing protein n=1 Tax=Kingdonia uniflora TaxID=39325 RepID=A0A7J7N291_9MAGN|nr:hypothetical protein GIB67_007815 [Kingdonia uniflora]
MEGHNARRFKKLYADKEDVLVPDIFWDYMSLKVSNAVLGHFLNMNFFHADLHPGNLLATPEGKLVFLNFGMMNETPEEDFMSADVDVSPIMPALRNFFDDALTLTVSELNFKALVDGLGVVLYQYPFNGHGCCYSCYPLRVLLCLQWKKEEGSTLYIIECLMIGGSNYFHVVNPVAAHNPEITRFGVDDIKDNVDGGWSYGNRIGDPVDFDHVVVVHMVMDDEYQYLHLSDLVLELVIKVADLPTNGWRFGDLGWLRTELYHPNE